MLRDNPLVVNVSRYVQNLSSNDQRALLALVVAVVMAFLYFAIWAPSQRFHDRALAEYEAGKKLVQNVSQNESLLRELSQSGAESNNALMQGQSIVSVVSSSARPFNLALKRVEPSGEQKVRVWLEKVEFNQTLRWLDSLNKRYGISASDVQFDKEEASGVISARMTLQM